MSLSLASAPVVPVAAPPAQVPQPVVIASPPQAKFVSDVTLADGCAVRPGERLNKTWRVRNSGQERWPNGTRIAHVGGDAFGGPAEGVEVPLAAPGEAVNVTVPLTMPMLSGRYTSYWRLMTPHPENSKFGHRFWVTVNVLAAQPVVFPPPPPLVFPPPPPVVRAPPPPPVPTFLSYPAIPTQLPGSPPIPPPRAVVSAPDPFEIPAEYVETVSRIADFGFTDIDKIVKVLTEVRGDAAAAIEKLLEE